MGLGAAISAGYRAIYYSLVWPISAAMEDG
jgi:hypothetical protein